MGNDGDSSGNSGLASERIATSKLLGFAPNTAPCVGIQDSLQRGLRRSRMDEEATSPLHLVGIQDSLQRGLRLRFPIASER